MSTILTSDKLIKSIKRRGFVPNDQVTFTDEDLLEMATEEITIGLMEQIIENRGDYLVYYIDVPIVQGQSRYSIPARAHGTKLREASINDINDPNKVVYDLFQIGLEDLMEFRNNYYSYNARTVFYLENNELVLMGDMVKSGAYILRMYFYMRPNRLVPMNRAGVISTITDGTELVNGEVVPTKTLSFTTLPKHFTAGLKYDFVGHKSPSKIKKWSITPVNVNLTTKTITIHTKDLGEIVVGDYVTQEEESIVPNIPTEYHPVVAQRTVRACMEAMNDDQGFQKASVKLAEMEKQVSDIVRNRVEGSPRKIKNRMGTLRQGINKVYRKW